MILSPRRVADATGSHRANVHANWPGLVAAMEAEGMRGEPMEIAVAATVAVETAFRFLPLREFGSHKYLDKYDTGALAKKLGNTPEDDDDGIRYCGRGYFQHTGLANYRQLSAVLGVDLIGNPDLLLQPTLAAKAAAHYMKSRNIVAPAEAGDWEQVRRRVNGGLNGYADFRRCVDRLLVAPPVA